MSDFLPMKKLCLILVSLCVALSCLGQSSQDSVLAIWENEALSDSVRASAFKNYVFNEHLFSQPDTALALANELLEFSEEQRSDIAKAFGLQLVGVTHYVKGNFAEAIKYYSKAEFEYEKLGNHQALTAILNNTGIVYASLGNNLKALDYYERCRSLREELGDSLGLASIYSNIGNVYNEQGDQDKALYYQQTALDIYERYGDLDGQANALTNLGNIHSVLGDYKKVLEFHNKSLGLYQELNDDYNLVVSLSNVGGAYSYLGDRKKAVEYCTRGLELSKKIGHDYGTTFSYYMLGFVYSEWQKPAKAIEYCTKALEWSEKIGSFYEQERACKCLYDGYKAVNNGEKALFYLEKGNAMGDSLQLEETAKKLQQMEFQKAMLQDSIANAEEARLIEEAHQEEIRQKKRTRNIFGGVGFFALLLAGGFYWRWRYVRKSKAVLQVEKDRSENLLLNILPEEIAEELKEKGRADARDFENVSILFTDFKGFTAASEKLSAQDLVTEINACFEAFDGIMGKYGIEKIKTIGDAYMAAGGLPVPTDDSVKNTVLAALEMQSFILDRKAKLDKEGKPGFEMRVGVHTGPVVAGIVGVKKFQYDIWGDTVNTASRMESSGEVGKVNISEATYELLKDDSQFTFESRGKVAAKGKGEMEMYFVEKSV